VVLSVADEVTTARANALKAASLIKIQ
jgi:hypothetical protein